MATVSPEGVTPYCWKGQAVLLQMSIDANSGFKNVNKLRTNKNGDPVWYAKLSVDGEKGQRMLPGSCSTNPVHSAAELAYFLAGHRGSLENTQPRNTRRTSEV